MTKGAQMKSPDELYAAMGRICDSCIPVLRSWCDERHLTMRERQITRQPNVEAGMIAFLWVFAELQFADEAGSVQNARVVVVPSRFLEGEREELEKAFGMVLSTFGYGSTEPEQEFVPFVFTEARPSRLLALLDEKGIRAGEELYCVTPEGVH